jgi:phosphoglycerate dehydrogenase-like enzyme
VLATPHLGYVTQEAYRGYFTHTVEDIRAFLDGRPIRVLNG